MRSRKLCWLMILAVMANMILASSALALSEKQKSPDHGKVKITTKDGLLSGNGKKGFVLQGNLGKVVKSEDLPGFLVNNKQRLFNSSDKGITFKVKATKKDNQNKTHTRLQQYYNGIPVYGKEVIVHTDKEGIVKVINGDIAQDVQLNTNPAITASVALQAAKDSIAWVDPKAMREKISKIKGDNKVKKDMVKLVIYNYKGSNVLTFVTDLLTNGANPGAWRVFVDAQTGEVVNKYSLSYDLTRTTGTGIGYFGNQRSLKIIKDNDNLYKLIQKTASDTLYDYNAIITADYQELMAGNDPFFGQLTNIFNLSKHKVAVDAHYNEDIVYNYFKTMFGRNGWDNQGRAMSFIVNDNSTVDNTFNAFWDSYNQAWDFGSGDGVSYAPFSSGLDVVAHEYTHAITDAEAGLEYADESGALNESISDVFASLIDPDWQLGEDVVTPGVAGDALRDMSNPRLYGQPENYNDYYYTADDNGGVHTNSGIPNKAFFNLVAGTTISQGISRTDAARIYYKALTDYLFPTAGFYDAKYAILFAAEDLYGIGSTQFDAVSKAWGQVGVYDPHNLVLAESSVSLTKTSAPYTINAKMLWDDNTENEIAPNLLTYSSSNGSVATVSADGIITPVGVGTADIMIQYSEENSDYYYQYPYTITAKIKVNVDPTIKELKLNKEALNLVVGGSGYVKATAMYDNGNNVDVTKNAKWTSSDSTVASVTAPGTIKALAKGTASITVQYGGQTIEIPVKVTPVLSTLSLKQGESQLTSSSILDLTTGDSVALTSIAKYLDSTSEDVTSSTQWTSSNTNVATVSTDGTVTAHGKGKASITAKFGTRSARVSISVTPVTSALEVSKNPVGLVIGGPSVSLKVKAYYVDGSYADVTRSVTWQIADTNKATVNAGRLMAGMTKGDTVLTVKYKVNTAHETVLEVPVAVTPKVTSLNADQTSFDLTIGGNNGNVRLTAFYNDNSSEDVTTKANWKTSRSSVVSVLGGVLTPVGKGTTTVTGEFNGRRVTIKVLVTPEVREVTLDRSSINMLKGSSNRLTLKAYYVDGSTAVVTTSSQANWSSSDENVVTINAGKLQAGGTGDATITADYKGKAATSNIRVRAPLSSLTLTPTMSLGVGEDTTLTVTALYYDGFQEDVSDLCQYSSSNNLVVSVSGNVITPVKAGTATITARYNGKYVRTVVTVKDI